MSRVHKPRPRSRKRDPNRHRIVDAARVHFFSHGFRSVTMDDLAEELGISKKTLYAHFPGKTDLLEAVLTAKFADVEVMFKQATRAQLGDFSATLKDLLAGTQRELAEIKPPFVRDMRQKAPQLFKRIERRRATLIQQYFGKFFVEGQRAGMVRKDVPAKLIIEILLAIVQTIMNPAKMEELGMMPNEGFAGILKIVLEGALTAKVRKA
jgi:AcrR family transcriptional regulator